ncbi:MAG: hypothetical protein KAS13_03070 [Candidatus Omnitrophica bacterium]|nr:hypothetical protein [Candidatus Omnitrophota bacterium]
MRTGVSYMGHHNPRHIETDLLDIKSIGCDDVLLAAQENDFVYMTGKVDFFSRLCKEHGLRPLAIFWGVINYFGGGKSSQFLLNYPKAHQVNRDGSYNSAGCYNNLEVLKYIRGLIDRIAEKGFEGYFIDEPSRIDCFCASCVRIYRDMYSGDLFKASVEQETQFRKQCIVRYICLLTDYIKLTYPQMETICCVMPCDKSVWEDVSRIDSLDNLGSDLYWVNNDTPVEEMIPVIQDMGKLCKSKNKKHHQWLQCWGVQKGQEQRVGEQGKILLNEDLNALYVWAYQGQVGISESCDDPQAAWAQASQIIKQAKNR